MLNIGPGELIMICVVALIVLGPDKLPQAMRTVGQVVNQLRQLSNGFQQDLRQALEDETKADRPRPALKDLKSDDTAAADAPAAPGEGAPLELAEGDLALHEEAVDDAPMDDTPMGDDTNGDPRVA
jgi:sec-independent protein translocase protein TatB